MFIDSIKSLKREDFSANTNLDFVTFNIIYNNQSKKRSLISILEETEERACMLGYIEFLVMKIFILFKDSKLKVFHLAKPLLQHNS